MVGPGAYDGQADSQLVALVAERDGGALEALYGRYGKAAYSLARRMLSDEQLAQEVVQEVFLTLWSSAGRFDPERGTVSTYLLSVAHHRAVDVVRREEGARRRRAAEEVLELEADPTADVEAEATAAERRDEVRAALRALPPAQREALALAYYGGYTQREVAALVNVPLGTIKTRMAAGMRKLKEALAATGLEPGLEPDADAATGSNTAHAEATSAHAGRSEAAGKQRHPVQPPAVLPTPRQPSPTETDE